MKRAIILIFLIILLAHPIQAQESPLLPMQLYGEARSFNLPVNPGTIISAIDTEGNVCGRFTVAHLGHFGVLSCRAENTTMNGTGAYPGEHIRFRIGNFPTSVVFGTTANSTGNLYWESGAYRNITIVSPPIVCGDGFCDNYESCSTCPEDCGECPVSDPAPPPPSPPAGPPGFPDFGIIEPEPIVEECVESWSCSDWGICYPNGTQTRECIDLNACGTEDDKPEIVQECIYEPIEPVEEIPREIPERPRVEEPLVIEVCDERLPLFSIPSLIFIIILLLIVSVPLVRLKIYKQNIIKDKYVEEIEKLKSIYQAERKTYTFVIIVSVLGLIVYIYHYFFFLCKDVYYANLWLLALLVFLAPIFLNVVISFLKYSEKAKLRKMRLLNNSYYKHVLYMIKITNEQLSRSENEITQKIYSLGQDDAFKELVTKTSEIRNIYYDMTKLFSLYKKDAKAMKVEKDLLANMEKLDKNEAFNDAALNHPELGSLKSNLALLHKAYESKQELYDELRRIEKAAEEVEEEQEIRAEEQEESEDKQGDESNISEEKGGAADKEEGQDNKDSEKK